jgi:hypothetical protein
VAENVDAAALLDDIKAIFCRYIALPKGAALRFCANWAR